ncbi:unnamed protein product [Fusarium graminearum]|nr:unnamed protein product [Fusarium graminearum]
MTTVGVDSGARDSLSLDGSVRAVLNLRATLSDGVNLGRVGGLGGVESAGVGRSVTGRLGGVALSDGSVTGRLGGVLLGDGADGGRDGVGLGGDGSVRAVLDGRRALGDGVDLSGVDGLGGVLLGRVTSGLGGVLLGHRADSGRNSNGLSDGVRAVTTSGAVLDVVGALGVSVDGSGVDSLGGVRDGSTSGRDTVGASLGGVNGSSLGTSGDRVGLGVNRSSLGTCRDRVGLGVNRSSLSTGRSGLGSSVDGSSAGGSGLGSSVDGSSAGGSRLSGSVNGSGLSAGRGRLSSSVDGSSASGSVDGGGLSTGRSGLGGGVDGGENGLVGLDSDIARILEVTLARLVEVAGNVLEGRGQAKGHGHVSSGLHVGKKCTKTVMNEWTAVNSKSY